MLIRENISNYINKDIRCSCGRIHRCNIGDIIVKKGATIQLTTLLHKYHSKRPLMVCDETTYEIAGKAIEDLLERNSFNYEIFIFPTKTPSADMEACLLLERNLAKDIDLIIAVGSGTVNDVCRYVSYKKELPYFIYGTAPSMDGFASDVSPLIVNNLKTTYSAHVPTAIIGDIDILKDAPLDMIAAGAGDIFGKYTCLCDWKLSHIVTGEYYCEEIAALVAHSIEVVVDSCKKIDTDREAAVESIMEGLILSGIAMAYAGNSRPASGSEHHLSHYWEMMFLFDNKKPIFHGTKVGIGTVVVLKLYEQFKKMQPDYERAFKIAEAFDREKWDLEMKEYYKQAVNGVLELEDKIQKNSEENVKERLEKVRNCWEEIEELINTLPSSEYVTELLKTIKAPVLPSEVGVSDDEIRRAVICAKELRNRYGLLQMLYDFGMINEYAKMAVDLSKKD